MIGRNGIDAAAKRIKLNEFQFRNLCGNSCGSKQARVISPLVDDAQSFDVAHVRNTVFCQDVEPFGTDDLRNSAVDLRIEVVRTSGQNDPVLTVLTHHHQRVFTAILDPAFKVVHFFKSSAQGIFDFFLRHAEIFERFIEVLCG